MGFPRAEIRVYKKDGLTWETTYSTVNVSNIAAKETLAVRQDTFNLTLANPNKTLSTTLAIDDRIELFLYRGASATESDLVTDGIVTEIGWTFSDAGRMIRIKGANRTAELLGTRVLITSATNKKPYVVIQEVIDQVNNLNQASDPTHVRHLSPGTEEANTTIVTTKSDGTGFATKSIVSNYKTAYEVISQLSGNEYTGDGEYIFYINKDNALVWTYKNNQIQEGYTWTQADVEDMDVQKGTWGVFNCAIVNVGKDCYNHGNHTLYYNQVSMTEIGAKWKYLDKKDTSSDLILEEFKADITKWETDGQTPPGPTGNFPLGASYPYTMNFNEIDSNWQDTGSPWVVDDDGEFNNAIRRKATFMGKQFGKDFIEQKSSPRYKVKIVINGTTSFERGLMGQVTADFADLTEKSLRVQGVDHVYNNGGWRTTLTMEEDIE